MPPEMFDWFKELVPNVSKNTVSSAFAVSDDARSAQAKLRFKNNPVRRRVGGCGMFVFILFWLGVRVVNLRSSIFYLFSGMV